MAVHFPQCLWFTIPVGLPKKVFLSKFLQRFISQRCLKNYTQRKKKIMSIFKVSFSVKVYIVCWHFFNDYISECFFCWIYNKVVQSQQVSFIDPLSKYILSLHKWFVRDSLTESLIGNSHSDHLNWCQGRWYEEQRGVSSASWLHFSFEDFKT